MFLDSDQARSLLTRVDPARSWWGWPVGLRDTALLTLLASGLSAAEVSRLRASEITLDHGRLSVEIQRQGVALSLVVPVELRSRLLAWLTARRLWGTAEPVITCPKGPLSLEGIYTLLRRYRGSLRRGGRPARP
jgi:integrase